MPLTGGSILQFNSGSSVGDATVTLPNPTEAGSAVIICGFTGAEIITELFAYDIPTGGAGLFHDLSSGPGGGAFGSLDMYYKQNVAAGESSWTMTMSGSGSGDKLGVWIAMEFVGAGLDPRPTQEPWFLQTQAGSIGNPASPVSSDTTGFVPADASAVTDCFDSLGLAAFGANQLTTSVPVISNYSSGWYEVAQVNAADGSHAVALSVAVIGLLDLGRFQTSADVSPSSYMCSDMVVIYGDGGKYSPKYDAICGFEYGTATGQTSGSIAAAGTAPWDGSTGSPEVSTAFKRTGAYALKLSSAAAAENITWTSAGALGVFWPNAGQDHCSVPRIHFYFDSTLPAADTEIASIEAGSLANGVVLWYRSASQKLGLKIGTGSEILSDAVVAVGKWIGVDLRYNPLGTTHSCDWQVDYDSLDTSADPVAQTQATTSSMTWAPPSTFRLGWTTAKTATVYYDDIAYSKQWGSFPVGDVRIVGIKVDPAGTPTITGTTGNFETFTSNGTGAAWNAVVARNNIDDMPPTIGASSDGITQIAVAASDFVNIPMDTFTAAPLYGLRSLRWYVAGWAASGNPATLAVKSNDGTNDIFTVAVADHGFDDTVVVWLCGMQRRKIAGIAAHYPLSQAKLDALTVAVGGSTDANPDVGIHAVLAEVAYAPAISYGVSENEGGAFSVYVRQDPLNGAVASYVVTTPSGARGATFSWTSPLIGDGSHYTGPNDLWELPVGASQVADVTGTTFGPDPS